LQPVATVATPIENSQPFIETSLGSMTNQPPPQACTAESAHLQKNDDKLLLLQNAFQQVHALSVLQIRQRTRALLFDD
jgi:hypothetical protein